MPAPKRGLVIRDLAAVTREYVEPMLRSLEAGQVLHRRPAADVYRMFSNIPANPAVMERARALVEQLDALP